MNFGKAIIIGLLCNFFLSFSCKIRLTEINPSLDVFEIVNFDKDICSGSLIFSGNMWYKKNYKTNRFIDNFVLSGEDIAIISKNCDNFTGFLCYSFDKNFRVFNDVDLRYTILLNGHYIFSYYFKSGILANNTGSLSLIFSGDRYIWFWSGESLGKFNLKRGNDNFNNRLPLCYIVLNYISGDHYIFSFSGNVLTGVFNWYVNRQFLGSGQKLSISLKYGKNIVELKVYSGSNILCNSFYTVLKEMKYLTSINYLTSFVYKNIFSGFLRFTEVHPFDDKLPEYVEIKSFGNWSGNINIVGVGKGESVKSLKLVLYSGQIALITDKRDLFSGFKVQKLIVLDSINLADKGEKLILTDNSGNILDQIVYENGERNKSLYFDYKSGDIRIFDKKNISSPGIELSILQFYLNDDKVSESNFINFYIKLQNTKPFYNSNSVNFIAVFSGEELGNKETNYECKWYINDRLFFSGCNPKYIKFNQVGILPIRLVLKDKLKGRRFQSIYYLNYPQKQFCYCGRNSGKERYYYDLYKKWKNKYYEIKKQNDETKCFENKYLYLTGLIKIDYILPNPKGKDEGKEEIVFKVLKDIDLSGKFIKLGRKKYYLSGWGYSGQSIKLKDNFRLPNKGGCIYIFSGENIVLDKFCYLKTKSGKKVYQKAPFDFHDILTLRDIYLFQSGDIFCILFRGQKLFCKDIILSKIASYQNLKERCKDVTDEYERLLKEYKFYKRKVKKVVKVAIKYIRKIKKVVGIYNKKVLWLYDKLFRFSKRIERCKHKVQNLEERYKFCKESCKKKNEKMITSCREKISYYKNLYNKAKQKKNLYYQKYRLYKEFVKIVKSRIKDRWKPVWEKEGLLFVEYNFQKADNLINSGSSIKNIREFLIKR